MKKDIEDDLRKETEKWLEKAEKEVVNLKPLNQKGEEFITNIKAYISDCKHFLDKGDLINAFESIVWSFSWIEIGKELEILE